MNCKCVSCNTRWNVSIKAIIPKGGYKCPVCRAKEKDNGRVKKNDK